MATTEQATRAWVESTRPKNWYGLCAGLTYQSIYYLGGYAPDVYPSAWSAYLDARDHGMIEDTDHRTAPAGSTHYFDYTGKDDEGVWHRWGHVTRDMRGGGTDTLSATAHAHEWWGNNAGLISVPAQAARGMVYMGWSRTYGRRNRLDIENEGDFLMGLAQWQQEAIFNALWSPQGYYKTDAIVNILRGEIEPRIDSIAAGNVLFPGAPYNAFQALANNQHAIMEAISKIDPNGDPVDFERILRESEDRIYAGFKAQFEAFSAVMRAELVTALADAEGLTKEQIMEAVDGSFARAFAPLQANVDASIAGSAPESSA